MSRFKVEANLEVGETSLTVKVQDPGDHELVKRAGEVLERSQRLLMKTREALSSPAAAEERLKVGLVCFWPNELKKEGDLATIDSIFDRIYRGLNSRTLQIKTSKAPIQRLKSKEDVVSIHGAVSNFRSWNDNQYDATRRLGYPEGDVKRDQPRDIEVKGHHNVYESLCNSGKQRFVAGTIRIQGQTLLNDTLGPVTLLHEASHRYAGTLDKWNFPDDAGTGPLSLEALRTRIQKKVSQGESEKVDALHNADSYAWFIYLLGS